MRIAIFGGSFNPIHYGHVGLAKWVAKHTDVDEVWMLITPNNPLKSTGLLDDEQRRLEAARKAVEDIPNVTVSDFEFNLPRPSYTAKTLKELKKAYPEHTFILLIGQDNWAIRTRWREWGYIERHFRVLVYPRGKQTPELRNEIKMHKSVKLLDNAPLFDVSSTQLREQKASASKQTDSVYQRGTY